MGRFAAIALALSLTVGCSGKSQDQGKDPAPTPTPSVAGPGTGTPAPAPAPAPDAQAPAPTAATVTDDALPDHGAGQDGRGLYYARALTDADLDGRTLRDLALMRNTIYARAGHSFRKAWLRDYFTAQPWYKALPADDNSKLTATDRANAKAISAREAAFPRDAMVTRQAALAGQASRTPVEDVELRLLGEQLGKAAPAAAQTDGTDGKAGPLEDPAQLDRLLTVDELADLSRRDLRILRNTVYARHGRVFKSALLQDWFDNKDWYKPDPAYAESMLTSIDRKNVQLIRSVEDSLGGPLTDDQQRTDDGWWQAA